MKELNGFTVAVCFNGDSWPSFERRKAWELVCGAVYAPDVEDAELYEFEKDGVHGCVLSNLKLGKSRQVSRSLARCLPLMASVDWARPFLLHNALISYAELKPVGTVDGNGAVACSDGAGFSQVFSGSKGKRWINPWKKKRMLFVMSDEEKGAQRTARAILSSSDHMHTDRDIVVFPVEPGFLPEILLFFNDLHLQRFTAADGDEIEAATGSDGSVILGDAGIGGLKAAADRFLPLGFHRIVAETDARLQEDVPGLDVQYLDPSEHTGNLLSFYGFDRLAGRCGFAAAVAPAHLLEEAAALLDKAGLKHRMFLTPESEAERAAVLSALLDHNN